MRTRTVCVRSTYIYLHEENDKMTNELGCLDLSKRSLVDRHTRTGVTGSVMMLRSALVHRDHDIDKILGDIPKTCHRDTVMR
jgi:hypothetical protein